MTLRILITNDDGIYAPGLAVMERIARELSDDVWVVAPDFERSGAGRSVTVGEPVRVRQLDERRFSLVKGSPTDCVVVALQSLLRDHPPTLVLSGVNRGSNLADDLTYSGTVAGAMQATQSGVRGIAISQCFTRGQDIRWDTAEKHLPGVIRQIIAAPTAPGVFHNVNVPDVAPHEVRGVRAVRQGRWQELKIEVTERIDARDFPYAWLSFTHQVGAPDPDTDLGAALAGWVTVTPLGGDLTHHDSLGDLHGALS